MQICSFEPFGYKGHIIKVEVDLYRGIPGVDIVGLPDSAVKEARERVKIAFRNSGIQFPQKRVLINLAPADVQKTGSVFDLAMAIGIYFCSLEASRRHDRYAETKLMLVGELALDGSVRPVKGVLAALLEGYDSGIEDFFVPYENAHEAALLEKGRVYTVGNLKECVEILLKMSQGYEIAPLPCRSKIKLQDNSKSYLDFTHIKGLEAAKRALKIAATGMHHSLLFGPPGGGKTLLASTYPGIVPELSEKQLLEVSRIYSLAGRLKTVNLSRSAPFRTPHHSTSKEGLVGGGRVIGPGEISLAHCGVLFLDEAAEFNKSILQSLREPIEEGVVSISRAGQSSVFPSRFQLIMAMNVCPCGNLGRKEAVCFCSVKEIQRYWQRVGGALLDRLDIRIPVEPASLGEILSDKPESSAEILKKVIKAREIQAYRYRKEEFSLNGLINPGRIHEYIKLDSDVEIQMIEASKQIGFSSRACISILKLARSIADYEGIDTITKESVYEAMQHRRYGDNDYFYTSTNK